MKANLEKIIKDGLNSDRSKQRNVDHFIFDPKFDMLTQNELVGFESKSGKSLHTLRGTISMRKFGNVNRKGRKIELYVLSTDECRFAKINSYFRATLRLKRRYEETNRAYFPVKTKY